MKRFKRKRYNKQNLIIILIVTIILEVIFFINYIGNKLTPKLITITKSYINKYNDNLVQEYIDVENLSDLRMKEIINLVQNKNDEIVAINYNMQSAYSLLGEISKDIRSGMNKENTDKYFKYNKIVSDHLILFYPLGLISNNILLNNLGSKIPVNVNLNSSILTGFKTKVSNYGINNVLIELYLKITLRSDIITPINQDDTVKSYEVLFAASVVTGNVPSFLNGSIEQESLLLNN